MNPTLGDHKTVLAAACAYLAITFAIFQNLLPVVGERVYADPGDPLLNTAILLWNATVTPLSRAWWNFPSFAPVSGVTAWTEHLLGAYPLTSPLIWMTGNAVLAYNVMELACFPLNGLCTFLLVRELTGSAMAGFVGGLAFAFAPYVGENASHLQMLMAFGMPFTLFCLHRYLRTQSRWALVGVACGWLSALLSSAYMLVFFSILVGIWCLWFLRQRPLRTSIAVLGTLAIATLPVIPVLTGYLSRQAAYGFSRPYSELLQMSATVTGLSGISHRAVFWRGVLPETFYEGSLFPGLCIGGLAAIALVKCLRKDVAFYLAGTVVMWSLTLGPEVKWSSDATSTLGYGPYWLLLHVPGAQSIRVPARAWLPAALCLAVCAGAGAAWLLARFKTTWVVVPLALAIVCEGWFVDQTSEPPRAVRVGLIPEGGTVLDLPLYQGFENAGPQYLAVASGYRSVNGYSGYAAAHFAPMRQGLADHQSFALDAFRRRGDLYVLVRPTVDQPFVEWLEQQPQIEFMATDGDIRVYRLPRFGLGPAISPLAPLPREGQAFFSVP